MDARYSKMVRDREDGEPQGCDLGFHDDDPSVQYVANEQHKSGLLARFLQDSVRMPAGATARKQSTLHCLLHNSTVAN